MRLLQIGLGPWGLDWATHVLPKVSGLDDVAHVDLSDQACKRAIEAGLDEKRVFSSVDDAIEAHRPDAVLATVPLAWHRPVVEMALAKGLHVLVEKPFTEHLADAVPLVRAAAERGLLLLVNQNYRHYPAPIAVRKALSAGAIGTVDHATVSFRRYYGPDYRYFFLAHPLLSDMAIHHFDLMRFVLDDEPVEVACRTTDAAHTPFEGPPTAAMWVRFKRGTLTSYDGSWLAQASPTPWAGEWVMNGREGSIAWQSRGDGKDGVALDKAQHWHQNKPGKQIDMPAMKLIDREGMLQQFADAVDRNVHPDGLSTGEDNLKTLAISDAAILSASRDGAPVAIEEVLT